MLLFKILTIDFRPSYEYLMPGKTACLLRQSTFLCFRVFDMCGGARNSSDCERPALYCSNIIYLFILAWATRTRCVSDDKIDIQHMISSSKSSKFSMTTFVGCRPEIIIALRFRNECGVAMHCEPYVYLFAQV